MKRLNLNSRVGGIDPGDRAAVAEAERRYKTSLQGRQLREELQNLNANRPEGAARLRGAFRATTPRGNLLRDPNELSEEQVRDLREANNHRGAQGRAEDEISPSPKPEQYFNQDQIMDLIGKGFRTDSKERPTKKWPNVVLGMMTNLKILCPGAQGLPQMLLTARRLDEATKSGESEPEADKAKDIRSWLLEE